MNLAGTAANRSGIGSVTAFVAAATSLLLVNGSAGLKATAQPREAIDPLHACAAVADPDAPGLDRSGMDAQLLKPDNRVEGQDLSGQDLAGKNFRGKVLIHVKLKGARLHGVDLTEAIICDSDLTGADFTAARLDRALIGGGTKLNGASFNNVSARSLKIADASGHVRIDGANLRGASLVCDSRDSVHCISNGVFFDSMIGADLSGAAVDNLCCALPGLGSARLEGVTTQLSAYADMDFVQLAAGAGESGRITFIPEYGYSGRKTQFTGKELRRLAALLGQMQSTSAYPSFDCSRARTKVERAICADPKLAALDRAMNWLWEKVEHTPQQTADQKKWLGERAKCPPPADYGSAVALSPSSFISPADPQGCIGLAYAERIKQLAPKSSPAGVDSGTYTTDRPLQLPQGQSSALAEKFFVARGFREDEITIKDLGNGAGKISGFGVWANGHQCGFEASDAETKRVGAQFLITDQVVPSDDRYSISFAVTPQVVIRVGGEKQFQCGARGGWSDAYFRQPDYLIAKLRSSQGLQ